MDEDVRIVTAGTVLFLGTNESREDVLSEFEYGGMLERKIDRINVIYLTSSERIAEGYARCFGTRGWVKKYIVLRDFMLSDVTGDMLHYEADEVQDQWCSRGLNGYYIEWKKGDDEIALCSPQNLLKFIGAKFCKGHGIFSGYLEPA